MAEQLSNAVALFHIARPSHASVRRALGPAYSAESLKDHLKSFFRTVLHDPYSEFLTAQEYQTMRARYGPVYTGLGIEIGQNAQSIVLFPYLEGPAYLAGAQAPAYQVLAVNDALVRSGTPLSSIERLLSANETAEVKFQLRSLDDDSVITTVVRPQRFIPRSVEIIPEANTSYIRLREFVQGKTTAALSATIAALVPRLQEKQQPLILDLRLCAGGDLYEAIKSAALFLPGNVLVATTVDNDAHTKPYRTLPHNHPLVQQPVLLLTGPETASSAEVFSAALAYHERAYIVGQTTCGKCTSQTFIGLRDGSALKLTNLKIFYPSGVFCNGQGIRPQFRQEAIYPTGRLVDKLLHQTILIPPALSLERGACQGG